MTVTPGRNRLRPALTSAYHWLGDRGPEARIVLLLTVLALIRGVLYAAITPPFTAPDEKGHYDYLASLYQNGWHLIQGREREQPPLYYILSLPAFAAFAGQSSGLEVYALAANQVSLASLLAVRCFSVILTAVTIPLAYWTARTLCPGDRFVSLGTAAFVALVPAYGWVGASVNNDNLANVFSSLVILLLLRGISWGFTANYAILIAALVAAGIATKPTTLPVAFLAPVVIGLRFVLWRWTGRRAATVILIVAALCALFFATPARNLVIGPLGAIMKRSFTLDFLAADRVRIFLATLDVWPFVYQFKTFWGSFSNDSIMLPRLLYGFLAAVTAMSMLGLLFRAVGSIMGRGVARGSAEGRSRKLQITMVIGIVFLEWLISFSRFYNNQALQLSTPVAGWNDNFTLLQGRFLFPAMVPIAFLFAWGLRALLPPAWAKHGTWVLVGVLVAVDWIAIGTLALGGHAWPTYFGGN